jgi:hypothetical protein
MVVRVALLLLLGLSPVAQAGRFDTRNLSTFIDDCRGKILRTALSKAYRLDAQLRGTQASHDRRIARLAAAPSRELAAVPLAREFLRTHPAFVSVTTIPSRLPFLEHVLRAIDSTYLTEILVVIPQKFGRDASDYEIPASLTQIPKVRILRPPEDIGPASKLLPAARWLAGREDDPLLITIDDDMIYPAGMVNEMILAAAARPSVVHAGVGTSFKRWNLAEGPSEAETGFDQAFGLAFRRVDVVEGFTGIAYPVKRLPLDLIDSWIGLSPECRYSDDLVVSLALRKAGIERYEIRSRYYSRDYLYQLPLGFLPDALHKGAGLNLTLQTSFLEDSNQLKYRRAFAQLCATGDQALAAFCRSVEMGEKERSTKAK